MHYPTSMRYPTSGERQILRSNLRKKLAGSQPPATSNPGTPVLGRTWLLLPFPPTRVPVLGRAWPTSLHPTRVPVLGRAWPHHPFPPGSQSWTEPGPPASRSWAGPCSSPFPSHPGPGHELDLALPPPPSHLDPGPGPDLAPSPPSRPSHPIG